MKFDIAIAYNPGWTNNWRRLGDFRFRPEKDQVGFNLRVNAKRGETVDHVEVHPWLTSYSASLEGGNWWNSLKKGEWNFVVDRYHQFAGGAMLENQTDRMLTETFYILTVSDENDRICRHNGLYMWSCEENGFRIGGSNLKV